MLYRHNSFGLCGLLYPYFHPQEGMVKVLHHSLRWLLKCLSSLRWAGKSWRSWLWLSNRFRGGQLSLIFTGSFSRLPIFLTPAYIIAASTCFNSAKVCSLHRVCEGQSYEHIVVCLQGANSDDAWSSDKKPATDGANTYSGLDCSCPCS